MDRGTFHEATTPYLNHAVTGDRSVLCFVGAFLVSRRGGWTTTKAAEDYPATTERKEQDRLRDIFSRHQAASGNMHDLPQNSHDKLGKGARLSRPRRLS